MNPQPPSLPSQRYAGATALAVPPAQAQLRAPQLSPSFPDLEFGSDSVQASEHVSPGTGWRSTLGWILVGGGLIVATVASMGVFLGVLLFGAVAAWFQARKTRALIHGQAVKIDAGQLTELHTCVESFSARLGLKDVPEVYMLEDGAINAFALKIAGKDMMLMTDDAIWGALQSKNPRSLGFIVGHELAHFALGHTGHLRNMIATVFPPLRRLDELSADNVARALVGDDQVAFDGVKLLTVGPQMSHYMNDEALKAQAEAVVANKLSAKVEKTMSHPLLMRRLHNVMR